MEQECEQIVSRICNHSADVIAMGKQGFYSQVGKATEAEAYASAQSVMVHNAEHAHCQQGIEAFFQKRKPVFH